MSLLLLLGGTGTGTVAETVLITAFTNLSPRVRFANISPGVEFDNLSPRVRFANISPGVEFDNLSPRVTLEKQEASD
jgi:hypothetical protein